jgi:hypothetical protein
LTACPSTGSLQAQGALRERGRDAFSTHRRSHHVAAAHFSSHDADEAEEGDELHQASTALHLQNDPRAQLPFGSEVETAEDALFFEEWKQQELEGLEGREAQKGRNGSSTQSDEWFMCEEEQEEELGDFSDCHE